MSMTTTTGAETLGRSGAEITIDGVSKTFGLDSPNPFQALKRVDVNIRLAESVSIVGPSGRGEIVVDLPRPRPIVLGESPAFGEYVDRIYHHFERLGVLNGVDLPKDQS